MRSDYALYAVATILFIITITVLVYPPDLKELYIVTTTVLGFLFIGLGYTQRPKPKQQAPPPPQAPTPTPTPTMETIKEEKTEIIVEAPQVSMPPISELTKVKGIGSKRSEKLNALGIKNLEDLAKASAEDLASKLKISPKITSKWINEAKKLTEKS